MAYTAIDDPSAYFKVQLFTGTGSSNAVTFNDTDTDMQPDLVWIKSRDDTNHHYLFDSVRGTGKEIYSNLTNAEVSDANGLSAFGSDGFTVGSGTGVNGSSDSNIAWCWKAGTAFSNDASGTSVGDIDSAGSISTAAGISIMSYIGNGTANQSVAHGLGAVPKFIIIKNRTTSGYWPVTNPRFVSVSDPNVMYLQVTSAEADDTNINGTTAPSSTVFGIDDYGAVNTSGDAHIAYCFAEKQGYSKFGSYTGNGNADGTFVYTGFRPAFLLTKRTDSTAQWHILDNKRDTYNPQHTALFPDATDADTTGYYTDFLSNGFKFRSTTTARNGDGNTYIYMAFAEAPFVNSNGVPCNAR